MSRATIDLLADRLGEQAADLRTRRLRVILHGGEPLLAGTELIEYATRAVRSRIPTAAFVVQTNGVLLDEAMLECFAREQIAVGVSLDGGRIATDRHRRDVRGRSSYPAVTRALRLLGDEAFHHLYAGLLCTVDVRNDPVGTYEQLLAFNPPMIDLLLPHGNWIHPPPRPADAPAYADWLIAVFDRWYGAPRQETSIRLFESIIDLSFGRPSRTEGLGLDPVDLVVVETDGSLEQIDALKTAADGAATTGLHLARHSFRDVARHPGIRARRAGLRALAQICHRCPVVRVCGGGMYAHRYAPDGFENPSVYGPYLYRLITHVQTRLRRDLTARGRPPQIA